MRRRSEKKMKRRIRMDSKKLRGETREMKTERSTTRNEGVRERNPAGKWRRRGRKGE